MTDDFAMYTHNQKALPAGFPKCSSLLADFPVVEAKESGKKKKKKYCFKQHLLDWG